ncbi:MAG: IS200/IS605 family transposase [Cyanophyceae cyanobacterium]
MKDDFVSSGRAISDLKAHLILTTKYRRKVLSREMIERLQALLWELCCKWDCKMIEANGEADHIHLLFQYYPQLELPKLVGNIKSITSRRLRSEFPELTSQYKKAVLWNEAYFIASCGGVTVSPLKAYVEKQNTPD